MAISKSTSDPPDTSDPEALLVEGSGNFTDQVQEDFAPVGQKANEEEVDLGLQGDEEECVDCEVTDWSDWSPCSAACNSVTTSRTHAVVIPGTECGNPCPPFVVTEQCNTEPCPTSAILSRALLNVPMNAAVTPIANKTRSVWNASQTVCMYVCLA